MKFMKNTLLAALAQMAIASYAVGVELVPLPLTSPSGLAPYTWSNACYWTNSGWNYPLQQWQFNRGALTRQREN